ncbi:MAG TPA: PQQ-binding-like beta-propeller repeat protein, partial [Pyrinomonadaceae bacterium]|nr:PQQ-binding-like beta-propeller repeat protein [Pyrinomonadaceae bacterium]
MKRLSPSLQINRRVYIFSGHAALLCALLLTPLTIHAQDLAWPQFRGPESNPVGTHARLADRWSKTENIEWSFDVPGRGWSSPIVTGGKVYVTTVTTEGKSKEPQVGTEYSNEYVAELQKQGLSMPEIIKRLNDRDIELPN